MGGGVQTETSSWSRCETAMWVRIEAALRKAARAVIILPKFCPKIVRSTDGGDAARSCRLVLKKSLCWFWP